MGVLVVCCLCLFVLVLINCMVQTTWWSPAGHWRNICLITLASYKNVHLLLFLFLDLMVSSTGIYQHFVPLLVFTTKNKLTLSYMSNPVHKVLS